MPVTAQVWLAQPEACLVALGPRGARGWLSPDEQRIVDRVPSSGGRAAVLSAWILRRWLLGRALSTPPENLRFGRSPAGGPYLVPEPGRGEATFSVSHCAGAVAVALAGSSPVGVDVECWQRRANPLALAARFFSVAERRRLEQLEGEARVLACFRSWTEREALGKALGVGLAYDGRCVTLPSHTGQAELGEECALLPPGMRCHLDSRAYGGSHLAAVAVLHRPQETVVVERFHFPEDARC